MDLPPEDAKLVTLSRTSRARTQAAEGAAVRDRDGRTYAASTVTLDSFAISALRLAIAMAVSSGAKGLEAAALVTEQEPPFDDDLSVVREFGGEGVAVFLADAAGEPHTRLVS